MQTFFRANSTTSPTTDFSRDSATGVKLAVFCDWNMQRTEGKHDQVLRMHSIDRKPERTVVFHN